MEVFCSLFALVPVNRLQVLEQRLSLLCGKDSMASTKNRNSAEIFENFLEHERVYMATSAPRASSNMLRLISDLVSFDKMPSQASSTCKLIHVGEPDPSKARFSVVRPIVVANVYDSEKDALSWISSLAPFSFSFENLRKGKRYHCPDLSLVIELFQPFRFTEKHDLDSVEWVNPDFWILEVKSKDCLVENVVAVEFDLQRFATLIKDIVELQKIDIR